MGEILHVGTRARQKTFLPRGQSAMQSQVIKWIEELEILVFCLFACEKAYASRSLFSMLI